MVTPMNLTYTNTNFSKLKFTFIKYLWIIEMEWLATEVASWETNFCKLRSSETNCSDFLITSKFLVCAESLQSCLTLCSPMNGSPPDSSVHGVFSTQGSNLHPLHLSPALADRFFTTSTTWEIQNFLYFTKNSEMIYLWMLFIF